MNLLNVGFENAVAADRIVSIVAVNSTPVKRMIDAAKKSGMLIDATHGKKIKSVIITDSNHYILSALQADTLSGRPLIREKSQEKQDKKAKEPEKK
jgi:extracellular matrix regulatory protein A